IPIRLWSTVVSQLETRPCETTSETGGRSALAATARSLLEALLKVGDRRVELFLRPVPADRRHLAGAMDNHFRDPLFVAEQRVLRDVRSVAPLRGEAVALGADTDEGLLAELEL